MRINWKLYWKENFQFNKSMFPKMKNRIFYNVSDVVRLWFRITFSKSWRNRILKYKPKWVKK